MSIRPKQAFGTAAMSHFRTFNIARKPLTKDARGSRGLLTKQMQKKAKTDQCPDDQRGANALRLERAAGIEPARKAWEAFTFLGKAARSRQKRGRCFGRQFVEG